LVKSLVSLDESLKSVELWIKSSSSRNSLNKAKSKRPSVSKEQLIALEFTLLSRSIIESTISLISSIPVASRFSSSSRASILILASSCFDCLRMDCMIESAIVCEG
ncbi:hypothetical protein BpHYR1_023843, partial [Brachionus plicatilis]